jgi:hypothetical protein
MTKTAKPPADVFIAAGLRSDFIAPLIAATDAMTNAISERTSNRGRRNGGSVSHRKKLSAARKAVHALNAFVKSQLEDNPSLLRNWNLVKPVPRPSARAAAGTTPSTSSAPAPTPAPTRLSSPAPVPDLAPPAPHTTPSPTSGHL